MAQTKSPSQDLLLELEDLVGLEEFKAVALGRLDGLDARSIDLLLGMLERPKREADAARIMLMLARKVAQARKASDRQYTEVVSALLKKCGESSRENLPSRLMALEPLVDPRIDPFVRGLQKSDDARVASAATTILKKRESR